MDLPDATMIAAWWGAIPWGEVLQTFSVAVAAGTAIYSINAWRREHRDRRRIELAEEVLASFYQARDAIAAIPNPFSRGFEGRSRPREEDEREEQAVARDRAYVFYERYERHSELFSRLHALRYQFEANFGAEAAGPFRDINRAVNRVLHAADELARLWAEHGRRRDETIERLEEASERI